MDITLLYVEDCPYWVTARERVREAVYVAGITDAQVTQVRVGSQKQAERLGFHGSPTVLIDGADAFADAVADGPAPAGLSCRLYGTPSSPRGCPTTAELLAALRDRGPGPTGDG